MLDSMHDLWPWIAWGLRGLAGVLVAWGVWRTIRLRRRGGPRRCPRCWHDMSHTEGRRCPECGRLARRERHLLRPRRRRWPAFGALLLVFAADPVSRLPAVDEEGWPAFVPTTVLIVALPYLDRQYEAHEWFSDPTPEQEIATTLVWALEQRCEVDRLQAWQWALLVQCVLLDDPDRLLPRPRKTAQRVCVAGALMRHARAHGRIGEGTLARLDAASRVDFEYAVAWPEGTMIHAQAWVLHWDRGDVVYRVARRDTQEVVLEDRYDDTLILTGSRLFYLWNDRMHPLMEASPGLEAVPLHVSIYATERDPYPARQIAAYDIDLPVRVVPTIASVVEPIASPAADAILEKHFEASLREGRSGARDLLLVRATGVDDFLRNAGIDVLALTIELLDGDEVLARGSAWWSTAKWGLFPEHSLYAVPMEWVADGPQRSPSNGRIRLRGDPVVALRHDERTTCWAGTVTVPLLDGIDGR